MIPIAERNRIYPEDFVIAALHWSGVAFVTDSNEAWHRAWYNVVANWALAYQTFNDWRNTGHYEYSPALNQALANLRATRFLVVTSERYMLLQNIDAAYQQCVGEDIRATQLENACVIADIVQKRLWEPVNRFKIQCGIKGE